MPSQVRAEPATISKVPDGRSAGHDLTTYNLTLRHENRAPRRYPLTGQKPNARQTRFVLDDPVLRFWVGFVFPSESAVQRLHPARAFTELVKPGLESYSRTCFERLCREALAELYTDEGVLGFKVGEYWDPTA